MTWAWRILAAGAWTDLVAGLLLVVAGNWGGFVFLAGSVVCIGMARFLDPPRRGSRHLTAYDRAESRRLWAEYEKTNRITDSYPE